MNDTPADAPHLLKDPEQGFRPLLECVPFACLSLDSAGMITWANAAWSLLSGYTREEVVGRQLGSYLEKASMTAQDRDIPALQNLDRQHFCIRQKNGRLRRVTVREQIDRDPDGNTRQTHWVITDGVENTSSESRLRRAETRLFRAQQLAGVGFWEWNRLTDDFFASPNLLQLYGLPLDTDARATRALIETLVHPEDINLVRAARQRNPDIPIAGSIEFRIVRPDGQLRWFHTVTEQIIDENDARVVLGTSQDITDRRQVEDQLRASESRLRALFDQAAVGVAQLEPESGRFVHVNQYYCDLFGYSSAELEQMTFMQVSHPEEIAADQALMQRLRTGEINQFSREKRYIRKDGSTIWASVTVTTMLPRTLVSDYTIAVGQDISARKASEQALRREHDFRMELIEALPGIFYLFDQTGRFLLWNRAFATALKRSDAEISQAHPLDLIAAEDRDACAAAIEKALAKGQAALEARLSAKDGSMTPFYFTGRRVDLEGQAAVVGLGIDLTPRRRAEEALHTSEERLRMAANAASTGLWEWQMASNRLTWNDHIHQIFGLPDEIASLAMQQVADMIHDEDREWVQHAFRHALSTHTEFNGEYRIIRPDGCLCWVSVIGRGYYDTEGNPLRMMGTLLDITERKGSEKEIRLLAFYDPLTHLPNRRLLLDRLRHALIVSGRNAQHGALLFIDLDHFKTLNDTQGHDVGDLLLIEVGKRLSACVRSEDTVARIGGDEFVVMIEELGEPLAEAATAAELAGEKMLAAINRPCNLRGVEYQGSPSIGICLYQGETLSLEEIIKRADAAMYQAKTAGRNTIRFYDPVMQAALEARTALQTELRRALSQQQFRLYYQAQVRSDQSVLGAEILLRWQHPERGLVPPLQFIPLAEESGLILSIGQWILETSCLQLKIWESDPATRGLQIAVNISPRQFRQSDFVDSVRSILERTGARPARLKLELTESLVLDDVDDTIEKMNALKTIGIGFSMDDFGTGYSSLAYLKRLPLDQLKIDQTFVRDIASDPNDAVIVRTIIGMAQNLGLHVIAEGVETVEQRDFLAANACPAFQGYLFSRPVPLADFENFLAQSLAGRRASSPPPS